MKLVIAIALIVVICIPIGCAKTTTPQTHSEIIRAALVRLLARSSGEFVIIEDAHSGKFVQFVGSRTNDLLLDLPIQTLSPDEMTRARAVFVELGYFGSETRLILEDPDGNLASGQSGFQAELGRDVDQATELALAVLYRVYELDERAALTVTEE